jgi:hypothetical protein
MFSSVPDDRGQEDSLIQELTVSDRWGFPTSQTHLTPATETQLRATEEWTQQVLRLEGISQSTQPPPRHSMSLIRRGGQ